MGSKSSSTKAKVFLLMNLIITHCYVVAAREACSGQQGQQQQQQAPPAATATCPRDPLKLGVCASLLGRLVDVRIGRPSPAPCCSLLAGLVDLDAAVCLCITIKANVLGISANKALALSVLLNACRINEPPAFVCA